MLIVSIPVAAIFLIVTLPLLIIALSAWRDFSDGPERRRARKEKRNKLFKIFIFSIFLVYPCTPRTHLSDLLGYCFAHIILSFPLAVSAQILQFFVCREVNGVRYLVVDFQLVCGSAEYNKYLLVAVFALLVYPIGTSACTAKRRPAIPHL